MGVRFLFLNYSMYFILNKLDATFKQAFMETPRDKYYTEFFRTIIYCNNHIGASFSNEKIIYAIHRVIAEEEANAYTITVYTSR